MSDQKQSPAEQIQALNTELTSQRAQAYEAQTALDAAVERINVIKAALQGAALGAQFQKEQPVEAAPEGDDAE